MKKNSFVIVLLVLLFSFNSTQAQLWKQIKNTAQKRAEDKATQKVLNKTDEAVDESFDQIEASMAVFGKNKLDAAAVPNANNFTWSRANIAVLISASICVFNDMFLFFLMN